MKDNYGECPGCRRHQKLTKHHCLPRRFFGSPNSAPILLICRNCHSELEKLIPEKEVKPIHFYWEVIFTFCKTTRVKVVQWDGSHSYYVSRYEDRPLLSLMTEVSL